MNQIVSRLLNSEEPAVRYKILVNVLGRDPASAEIQALRALGRAQNFERQGKYLEAIRVRIGRWAARASIRPATCRPARTASGPALIGY